MRQSPNDIILVEGLNQLNIQMVAYRVAISFRRDRVCLTERAGVCLEWADNERQAVITITNQGAPGKFTISLEGWLMRDEEQLDKLAAKTWVSYFEVGQTRTYKTNYGIPVTGEPVYTRFFVKVYDPANNIIADKVFNTPL